MTIQTYAEYRPTPHDVRGLGLTDRQDWLIAPVGRNRDSGVLAESNFEVVLKSLGGEGEMVEVHRFGHWACGWYEIVVCHPSRLEELEDWERSLAAYPIADEDDYSAREWDEACRVWARMSIKERVYVCQRYGADPEAACLEEIPECQTGELVSYLAGES